MLNTRSLCLSSIVTAMVFSGIAPAVPAAGPPQNSPPGLVLAENGASRYRIVVADDAVALDQSCRRRIAVVLAANLRRQVSDRVRP